MSNGSEMDRSNYKQKNPRDCLMLDNAVGFSEGVLENQSRAA